MLAGRGITLPSRVRNSANAAAQMSFSGPKGRRLQGDPMTHIEGNEALMAARQQARATGYVQRVQVMLMAAGIAAFGIVAVAATVMTTLL